MLTLVGSWELGHFAALGLDGLQYQRGDQIGTRNIALLPTTNISHLGHLGIAWAHRGWDEDWDDLPSLPTSQQSSWLTRNEARRADFIHEQRIIEALRHEWYPTTSACAVTCYPCDLDASN